MPGLGEGSEHGSAAGRPEVLAGPRALLLTSVCTLEPLGACEERHCLGPRPDSLNEMSRTQQSVISKSCPEGVQPGEGLGKRRKWGRLAAGPGWEGLCQVLQSSCCPGGPCQSCQGGERSQTQAGREGPRAPGSRVGLPVCWQSDSLPSPRWAALCCCLQPCSCAVLVWCQLGSI